MPRKETNNTNNPIVDLKNNATNVFSQNTALTEDVHMPSKGLIPGIPKVITIKAIQRKDKKKMLMSETDDILLSLLQASIVNPKDFNVYNLLPFESNYLLYRLRILTYGAENTFKDRCPYCGEINEVNINLNDIPVVELPDDFSVTFDIQLPISGDVLTCKLLTEGEKITVNKQVKEFKNTTGNDDVDAIWCARIVAINGNDKLVPFEKTSYLDEMNDYDSEYFMEYYLKWDNSYGLQNTLNYTCDKCSKKVESTMPSIYTFFRPTFKIDTIR